MTQHNAPLGRRPTKFTPERIELIRSLVERGTNRDEIARLLDVSLGSLQVTCSKLGISLRRPVADNGFRRREQQHRNNGARYNPTGRTALPRSDKIFPIPLFPSTFALHQRMPPNLCISLLQFVIRMKSE